MAKNEIFALILVFAATALIVYVFSLAFFRETALRAEEAARHPTGEYNPVSRFIQPGYLLQVRFAAAFFLGGAALCILLFLEVRSPLALLPGMLIPAMLGFWTPLFYFQKKVQHRIDAFQKRMLDLVMGVSNGLHAGMAFPQALEVIARDIGGPLQEEIGVALSEYRLGVELPDALDHINRRIPSEDLKLLITSVRLSQQTGGSLADVLDRMVDTIRQRTVFKEKLATLTAQGRFESIAIALMPVVAFIILYFIDPSLMKPLVTTGTGWCALGIVALLELTGFIIVRKIVTIEV